MEGVSEPTIKSEKEDEVWTYSEYKWEGTQRSVNLSENASYVKDFFQIKDEPEQTSDCIKEEVKDEIELRFEEWEESATEEGVCFPGCVEGDLTDASQVSLTLTGLPEGLQKIKVETEDDAEFNDLAFKFSVAATEGKTVKPGEENGCQVRSSYKPSTGLSSERIFRKKFGCEREAVVELARLSLNLTHPVQGTDSKRELEHIMKRTAMLDSNAKSRPQGPNMAEGPGSRQNKKDGSTALKESFCGRNIFGQLLTKALDKSFVNQHSPINSKEKQNSYNHCSYVASNKGNLNICITRNRERKFECAPCSYKTDCKSLFTQHCLNHDSIKKFACDQCSYKTIYKNCFTQHCLNHANIKRFACDQCSYKTNYRISFTRHCLNHTNIKQFACDQCSYKTNSRGNFTKHCLNHSNIRRFACGQCSYKTNEKSHFTRHCLSHSNIRRFACDQCSYKTNNKSNLAQHCMTHSNANNFACDKCSYKTNQRKCFTQHYLNHTSINKQFACDQCSYRANYKKYLDQHCLIHSNIKLACDQCSYKTNVKYLLKRHYANHSNIKRYVCDQCSYMTNNKGHFARHCRNHSNIKKISCN